MCLKMFAWVSSDFLAFSFSFPLFPEVSMGLINGSVWEMGRNKRWLKLFFLHGQSAERKRYLDFGVPNTKKRLLSRTLWH